jgi:hypothetical protein
MYKWSQVPSIACDWVIITITQPMSSVLHLGTQLSHTIRIQQAKCKHSEKYTLTCTTLSKRKRTPLQYRISSTMELDLSPNDNEQSSTSEARQKRSRILLSCAPCRNSKLKCDREQPCSQCDKKGRASQCTYAPKPEKKRPAKGMSARLKRLEGMVREMMDSENSVQTAGSSLVNSSRVTNGATGPEVQGQVVRGDKTTTYVGATHCMAMLEDVSIC